MVVSNNEGLAKGNIAVTIGTEVSTAGLPTGGAFDDNAEDPALDAEFTMNGVSGLITRPSNVISDLIPGVTLNLESTGTATVTIETDVAGTTASIQEFVDTFNEISTFVKENNLVIREENGEDVNNVFGPLSRTRVDDNVVSNLRSDMSGSALDNTNNAIAIFADLGITTERDGTLKLDESVLQSALERSPVSVNELLENFGNTAGVTSGTIDQYIRFNGLIDATTNGNSSQVSSLNEQIARSEAQIERAATAMRARFARLESLISELQNKQQSLTSLFSGG